MDSMSMCFSGILPMKIDESNVINYEDASMGMGEYPFYIPEVYLEGHSEIYFHQSCFDRMNDSVVLVRDNHIIEYTQSDFGELLAKDENGNVVWVDGRKAPSADSWDGEYLGVTRNAREYSIAEYNLETLEKKKYKVFLEETTRLDASDCTRLRRFANAGTLGSCSESIFGEHLAQENRHPKDVDYA